MPRTRKVVIVGTKGFKMKSSAVSVECFTWENIKKITNLRDYDTVIINLLGISSESARKKVNWFEVETILNIFTALSVLEYNGEIIIVGDPRFSVSQASSEAHKGNKSVKKKFFLKWTGMEFSWDNAPGDTIHFNNDYKHRQFEEYIKKLNKWEYSLQHVKKDLSALSNRFNLEYFSEKKMAFDVDIDFFCRNRYENGLAFILRLRITMETRSYYGPKVEPIKTFGPIIFLPKINVSEDETMTIVLRDICGVEAMLPEPDWLSDYNAPGQSKVDEEIKKIRDGIETENERLIQAQHQRERIRTCLKLLYEREFGLEPAVRDVLRGLGAHVEDPEEPNKEDGWITVSIGEHVYEGVLEIKSTRSAQFGEGGIRQLLDWIDRGTKKRQKKYKGIFIGNSSVDDPINKRPWAFSDDWTKSVELHEMCALTSTDLYMIHLLKSAGRLDLDTFWKDIFETNGIFDSKKYIEKLTREE